MWLMWLHPERCLCAGGGQVGLTAACTFVQLLTGVSVEPCVALTGEVVLTGAIKAVSGLEGKLRAAESNEQIRVVVLPESKYEQARGLVRQHGWSSLTLVPVRHMSQVIRLLFLSSVTQGQGRQAARRSGLDRRRQRPTPVVGRAAVT